MIRNEIDLNKVKNLEFLKKIRREDAANFETFDKQYNVDTSHPISLAPDGSGDYKPDSIKNHFKIEGSMGLQNSPVKILDIINEFMSKIPGIEEYTFLDVGSGKGKTILHQVISNAPYKKYIGVEPDEELNNIALNNLKTINIDISKDVQFIAKDIRDFDFSEEKCVYYFYYPFIPEIFDDLMLKKWEDLSKTKSFIVFHFEYDYNFKRFIKKDPIYDDSEIYIYQV